MATGASEVLIFANWSTLVVCMILKLPQILSVVSTRSALGLSLHSLLLELVGFIVFLRYQIYYDYPIETFLEYPILVAQDVILLLFVFHYSTSMKDAVPYLVFFVALWFILTLDEWIVDVSMACCTLISAGSKFAQLQALWRTHDSGRVSALTWGLATYTCVTRILSTAMTTMDMMVLLRYVVMLLLNAWVTATILHYRKTPEKIE